MPWSLYIDQHDDDDDEMMMITRSKSPYLRLGHSILTSNTDFPDDHDDDNDADNSNDDDDNHDNATLVTLS